MEIIRPNTKKAEERKKKKEEERRKRKEQESAEAFQRTKKSHFQMKITNYGNIIIYHILCTKI